MCLKTTSFCSYQIGSTGKYSFYWALLIIKINLLVNIMLIINNNNLYTYL
ncbi:hypothetical protein RhiirA5_363422 [Rhizophagus irregularis]|uniref:Uncharacterized protein n=1 Tax=Rhizophagus irregularis TaxID=588596 RepID=A0A2N0NB60_9GLOM|nr:hypothetical protein RhiirA5_368485 [Rhizophagus irregularis]PKC03228.1 hypothetical protein RhiirA5_363422 [Rhizophagus irregularis]